MSKTSHSVDLPPRFTFKIVLSLVLGAVLGLLLHYLPLPHGLSSFASESVFGLLGKVFLRLIQLLVVPIVFVSIVCGSANIGHPRQLGRIGIQGVVIYLSTTFIAIIIALCVASLLHVGRGLSLVPEFTRVALEAPPHWSQLFLSIFPNNPFEAFAKGNLLQVIVFALLFGVALGMVKDRAQSVLEFFNNVNDVLMKLIMLLMRLAPYGVFCLIVGVFAKTGFSALAHLGFYFLTVLFCLAIQFFGVYGLLLYVTVRMSIIKFVKLTRDMLVFAFSVSSSNATIPVTLETVIDKLNVRPEIASFIVPLGATINMDGTAMMQGVATIFIANAYGLSLTLVQLVTVVVMATLSSIGAAGVPSVGLVMLAMVLAQVGIPVEGIGLIIGIDRLLDMTRTMVNVGGDGLVCVMVEYFNKLKKN